MPYKNPSRGKQQSHPLWVTYVQMKQRCLNEKNKNFHRYGGRGIKMCDRWLESFWNFVDDMGERPEGHTLDRIDNDGNYEPSNCKWSTYKEQNNNKGKMRFHRRPGRCTRFLTYEGITLSKTEWQDLLGISPNTLWRRMKLGWTDEECLFGKPGFSRNRNKSNDNTQSSQSNQPNSATDRS